MRKIANCAAAGMLFAAITSAPSLADDVRTPAAIALQTAIERLCLPMLKGAEIKSVAKQAGAQFQDGRWWVPAAGRTGVEVRPPTPVNPKVCALRVNFPAGKDGPLYDLLQRWSAARGLHPAKVRQASRGPALAREISSWEGSAGEARLAIVFARELTLQGTPVNGDYGAATVLVSRS